jgi:peptidoglycan/LPS O-acetylase OafA/YrhL
MLNFSNRQWLTDRWRIDSLRGLACLLLVCYHAAGDFSNYTDQSLPLLQNINALLADMRMPLFSFISGIIFSYKPLQSKSWDFIFRKSQRLLIPFFVMTVVLLGMKTAYPNASVPVSIADLPYYLAYGYSHLWFLQAIFLIFCFYSILHASLNVRNSYYYIVFVCSLVTYFFFFREIEVLSIGKASYLLPFFTLGVLVTTNLDFFSCRYNVLLYSATICFLAALALTIYEIFLIGHHSDVSSLFVSLSFLIFIYLALPKVNFLYQIGAFSFTIFLLHSIFIALGIRLFPEIPVLGIPLTVALSILAPIAVEVVVNRFTPTLRFCLGKGFN